MSSMLSEAEAPPVAAAGAAGSAQSAGAWLRAVRQAQGLHIAALAAQLKVPQSKLEALENDRYEDLPDMTFARALAKAMCRVLKVDASPVLGLLPRGSEPALDRVTRGLNQPFRERPGREEAVSLDWLKRPLSWALAGLLLAALAVYLLPAHWLESLNAPAATSAATGESPVSQVEAPVAASAPLELLASSSPTETAPTAVAPAATAGTTPPAAVAPAPQASIAAPTPVVTPPVASAPSGPAPLQVGQVPLRVRATAESWVEVTDAKGQVLLSKLLRPGEQADLGVLPPLRLRVGNVAGTEISLRGAPVDLAAQAKDNVARLELN